MTKHKWIWASLFWAVSALATDGPISGGGGDLVSPDRGAAWFVGKDKPIQTCVKVSHGYGYTQEALQDLVRESFGAWASYMERKKYSTMASLTPSTKVAFSCAGQPELTFYFGINDELAVRFYRDRFDDPAAFAVRLTYNIMSRRGQGFVWVSAPDALDREKFPNLKNPAALRVILAHEIGHVLGVAPMDGTIMTENIVKIVRNFDSDNHGLKELLRFDYWRELLLCQDCPFTLKGRMFYEAAAKILGRPVSGNLSGVLTYGPSWDYKLTLSDDSGTKEFELKFPDGYPTESTTQDDGRVFRVAYWDDHMRVVSTQGEKLRSQLSHGYLVAANGQRFGILMERNMLFGPLRLLLVDHEFRIHQLFLKSIL